MPSKFKLLKDLPGCPKETVFEYDRDVSGTSMWDGAWPEDASMRADHLKFDLLFMEEQRDWFQPIHDEPERPYPWEPAKEEDYWYINPRHRQALRTANIYAPYDTAVIHNAAAYRTKEDAELRLKVEPLVNAAVKALLNRPRHWAPARGDVVWLIDTTSLATPKATTVGKQYPVQINFMWPTQEDTQAVCDLYNFFLTDRGASH